MTLVARTIRRIEGTYAQEQALSTFSDLVTSLQQVPFLQGQQLTDVSLRVGSTTINHTLGRVPAGYFVLKLDAAAAADYPRLTLSDEESLTLSVSTAATVDLWVF